MNELSRAIEQVIENCKRFGNTKITLTDKTIIWAEWQVWDKNNKYDVVEVYISKDDKILYYWQDEETRVLNQ